MLVISIIVTCNQANISRWSHHLANHQTNMMDNQLRFPFSQSFGANTKSRQLKSVAWKLQRNNNRIITKLRGRKKSSEIQKAFSFNPIAHFSSSPSSLMRRDDRLKRSKVGKVVKNWAVAVAVHVKMQQTKCLPKSSNWTKNARAQYNSIEFVGLNEKWGKMSQQTTNYNRQTHTTHSILNIQLPPGCCSILDAYWEKWRNTKRITITDPKERPQGRPLCDIRVSGLDVAIANSRTHKLYRGKNWQIILDIHKWNDKDEKILNIT